MDNHQVDSRYSLRTKITLMMAFAIIISMIIAAVLGVVAIRNIGKETADQQLMLLCETGQKNLDSYFNSVE